MCSAMNKESKPRSSIAPARSAGAMPSSVTNVEMPKFMALFNHTEKLNDGLPAGGSRYPPEAGWAGSGSGKRSKKRATAASSPSISTSPERSASARG